MIKKNPTAPDLTGNGSCAHMAIKTHTSCPPSKLSIRVPWYFLAITLVVFFADNLSGKKKGKITLQFPSSASN